MSEQRTNQPGNGPRAVEQAHQRRSLEREGIPYDLLVEAVKDYAIFMLDPDGFVVSWNLGAARIKGYESSEIIGRHFSTFYPRVDLEAGKPQRELEEAKAFGRVEDEGWRLRKDGSRFWANVVITALRGPDDRLIGFTKVTRDMTLHRESERRLRESEERFRLLVDSVADYAIFMLDPAGRVVSWNAGAQRIKGYSADEVIGRHFSIFYPQEDIAAGKPEQELRTALEVGRATDQGWRLRKDGSRFLADVVLTAIWDENGALRGYAKVTRDITHLRRSEEERRVLLEARIRAEETNRAKDEFLMTLSHELRTPMTSIMGWARLLSEGNLSAEETKIAIASIVESSMAQSTIIDDVLDVSRLITGKLRLRVSRVDVGTLARDLVSSLMPAARAKQITIVTDIDGDTERIAADPDRLRQILWNLLANAIKFSPKKKEIFLIVRRHHSMMEMTVEDRGPGVPADVLPYIFQPFVQADSSSTRRHGGLGLGLTIVRNLVELHGGTIDAENLAERGARFRVAIPIAAVAEESETTDTPRQRPAMERSEAVRMDGIRILFVDDHEASRVLVRSIFEHAGGEVDLAASVAEAVAILDVKRPDVVVTDLAMPDADGHELARFIREQEQRENTPHMPVIAFTAFGGAEARTPPEIRALFDGWLSKPIEPKALVTAVVRIVGNV